MTRAPQLSALLILGCLILASCGGVARNPSEPNFPGRGNPQQPGAAGAAGATGGAGQAVTAENDPNLAGATTPEDFRDRAHVALLQGNLVTGVNGYTKVVELNHDDPKAVFALAVTTLWRDADQFAALTASQLPLTFYNTPLGLVPTLIPQPLAQDDGYLWRLLSLSIDSQPGADPQKILADFLIEAGAQPPAQGAPRPQPAGLAPGVIERLNPGALQPSGGGDRSGEKDGNKQPPSSRGGKSGGDAAGKSGGDRSGAALAGDDEGSRSGQQTLGESRGIKLQGDEANKLGDSGDGGKKGGTEQPVAGQQATGNPDSPAAILSRTEYKHFERDRPGMDLVPKLRTFLMQRAALSFTWEGRSTRLTRLRQTTDELIAHLERTQDKVKDGFQLELPIMLGTKTAPEVHQIAFEKADYAMLLQQLKLVKWLLEYRSQYTTAGQWNFLVPPKDTDADGALSPAEYYPAAPFGTLTEAAKESLAGMRSSLGKIVRDMGTAMQGYRDAEIYSQSGKDYLLPLGLDQSLERVILDEYNRVLEVSLALPQESGDVQLLYAKDAGEPLKVQYEALFDGTLSDVRTLLPSFDATSRALMTGEGIPTSLMPTVLPENTPFSTWIDRSFDLEGLIVKSGLPLTKADVAAGGVTGQTGEGTGLFTLQKVVVTPLLGVELTISGAGLATPVTVLARVPNLLWDVSLPLQHGSGTPTGAVVAEEAKPKDETSAAEGAEKDNARGNLLGGLAGAIGEADGDGESGDKPADDAGDEPADDAGDEPADDAGDDTSDGTNVSGDESSEVNKDSN